MKLSIKLILAAGAAVVVTAAGGCVTVYWLSEQNRVQALHDQMSVALRQAETVAERMDAMYRSKAFDTPGLLAAAKQTAGGQPLKDVYSKTALYNTVPIVAAWQAAASSAKAQGFEFFTPARPGLAARNPKNDNGAEFAGAFEAFAAGKDEYFFHDKKKNELILARPVRLVESCLNCHGDPARSATADGKDVLGFEMENLKAGDVRGAFVLRAPMTKDAVVGQTVRSMTMVSLGLLVLTAAGFYCFSNYFINRPLVRAIQRVDAASTETNSAAAEIAHASHGLADSASQQASSLEETSASLEEMASMTKRNAGSAESAKALSAQTRAAADTGAADMREMGTAMAEVKAASDDISKIIKTIDEIAFQTNILALNAAVEAARAGEAGAGFAVVADEVRSLAQRSAHAARETAEKIENSILKSQRGAQLSGKVTASLQEIVSKARQVDELVGEIAAASKEQAEGIAQVNIAVIQMDKITQSNAASAEESASASEELNAQARLLRESLSELALLVGTGDAPTSDQSAGLPSATESWSELPGILKNGDARATISKPMRSFDAAPRMVAPEGRQGRELPMERDFRDF
jgi:methyl-accepting chemotaxis protein